jgi:hypothetical protein
MPSLADPGLAGPSLPGPSLAGHAALPRRAGLPAELQAARTPRERTRPAAPAPAASRAAPAAPALVAPAFDRGTGFALQQLLAAQPELRGPPASRSRTIAAYQAHLTTRIRFSGPVMPVDLRV